MRTRAAWLVVIVIVLSIAPTTRAAMDEDQMRVALDAFDRALSERWSYLRPSSFDHAAMIDALRKRIDDGLTQDAFVLELQKVIGRGMDGHAVIEGWGSALPNGHLPLLIEPVGDRFVAFKPSRDGFISADHPYLEAIDGRPVADWLAAASAYVPDGSPQFVRTEGLRLVPWVQFLRGELGITRGEDVELTLRARDRDGARHVVRVPVVPRLPSYGVWPREERRPTLLDGIAYLRLATMSRARGVPDVDLQGMRGLIIDVRDNGGGSRDALRALAARLMRPGEAPRVVNAAAQRRHPDHDTRRMASRFLYPEGWPGWSDAERGAIARFKKTFRPEWPVLADAYGEWHYTLVSPGGQHFDKPVVVLMNGKCFSAADVFLSGLRGLPNVTLLGTPSGGGSANVNSIPLGDTPLRVRLGTMVSFQATGKWFDGRGVEPDVVVEPEPEFFIGGRDAQLEAAVQLLSGSRP